MSVAFDDHGETVPSLGTMRKSVPRSSGADDFGPYVRSRSRRFISAGSSARATVAKCQYSAAMRACGSVGDSALFSFWRRKDERAARPRSVMSCDMPGKEDATKRYFT